MRAFVSVLSTCGVLLIGCGHDPGSVAHPGDGTSANATPAAPTAYDYAGPSGMLLSFDPDAPRYFPAFDCERAYQQVSACMSLTAPGPVVRVVKNPIVVDGREYSGYTDFTTGQITLVSCSVAPHEFVHYLLWASRFPNAENANHASDTFVRCGAPLTTPTAS